MTSDRSWQATTLGAVARIDREIVSPERIAEGTRYVGLEHMSSDGTIDSTVVGAGDLRSAKFAFTDLHVLYGKLRPYLRKVARPDVAGVCSTDILPILPGPELDRGFLFHLLRHPKIVAMATSRSDGVNLPRISPKAILRFPISLPSIPQQRQIADVLDRANAVWRRRRGSVRILDDLLHSSYLAMSGPGNAGYRAWPEYSIAQLAETRDGAMRTGPFGSALRHSEFTEVGEVAVLGIDNVVANHFRWGERRFISRERYESDFRRYTVKPGDVLVTIMGTTGRSAVVPDDIPSAISTKHLAVITLDSGRVLPEWLSHALHSDPVVLGQILAANRGAIMAGLNLRIIKELKVRLPPVEVQEAFATAYRKTWVVANRMTEALQRSEVLFGSLSQVGLNNAPRVGT